MKVALFPHPSHPESSLIARRVVEFFHEKNVSIYTPKEFSSFGALPLNEADKPHMDFLISMGGDGSILRLAHEFKHHHAAILGINLGHLGFMADVPKDDLIPSLEDFYKQEYTIDHRIVLEGVAPNQKKFFAINDFVLHRGKNSSLIQLSIWIDDLYVNTFEADGIIVATPNGSTAYSLAAGGPILSPSLEGIVITPICPHTISNRPIVLTPSHTLKIEYLSHLQPIEVIADGFETVYLESKQSFLFRKSSKTFRLVNLKRRDYFSTLRTKLGWSGKLR